jgi:hypothetical protein
MTTKRVKGVTHWATVAIRLGVLLVGQFNDGPRADPVRTATLFIRLRRLVRALPPNHILPPKFEENLATWPQTWESSEYNAARYQMVLLVRRLRRYCDEWGGSPIPVTPMVGILPTGEQVSQSAGVEALVSSPPA